MTVDNQEAEETSSWIAPQLEAILLAGILLLAGYLRLVNLGDTPGWYSDEGTILNIAANLLDGRLQSYALQGSTLLIARMPLFPLLASLIFRVFGVGIETLRALSAALGLISIATLYGVVRRCLGRGGAPLALLAATMLAIYPSAILYQRLGISYGLLTPLVILSLGGLFSYLQGGRHGGLILAATAVGIGAVSDLMMWSLLVPLLLIVSLQRPRDLPLATALALLPTALYAGAMLSINPEAFLFDVRFTLQRLAAVPLWAQPGLVVFNFAELISGEAWIAVGVIGLFALKHARFRLLSLGLFLIPMIVIGRSTGLAGLRLYYISPLFPFIGLGVASLTLAGAKVAHAVLSEGIASALERWGWQGTSAPSRWLRARSVAVGTSLGLTLILLGPFLVRTVQSAQGVAGRLRTPIDWVLVEAADARAVAAELNSELGPTDLVIASPAFGWTLESRVAGFQQALAAQGLESVDYPSDVPADRFAFDASWSAADYAVVDRIWTDWAAAHMPTMEGLLQEISGWELLSEMGEFRVYRNPES